jgi:exodeoxyribonuclease-3
MKIATWNVNSIKARLDHVKDWLAREQPDVLMLQELKGLDFPMAEFDAMGYASEAVGQKAYNGVAILSKRPFSVVLNRLPGDAGDEQARYLEVDCEGLRLICLYLPNGNPVGTEKYAYKLAWMERLYSRLAELRREDLDVIAGGDYNVIPEPRDVHNPAAWEEDALYRLETRQAWRKFLHLGYYDALRIHNPMPAEYTFWDYTGGAWPADKGIRIDHFLLSPAMADRAAYCTVDRAPRALEKASDHTPVVLGLRPAHMRG